MIKINLARRRSGGSAGGGLKLSTLNLETLRDFIAGEDFKRLLTGQLGKLVVISVGIYAGRYGLDVMRAQKMGEQDKALSVLIAEQSEIEKKLAQYKSFEPLRVQLEADEKTVRTKLDVVTQLLQIRGNASKMLLEIAKVIPEAVWITSLQVTDKTLKLSGATTGYAQVSEFLKALNSTGFLSDVSLSGVTEGGGGAEGAVQTFEINAVRRQGN